MFLSLVASDSSVSSDDFDHLEALAWGSLVWPPVLPTGTQRPPSLGRGTPLATLAVAQSGTSKWTRPAGTGSQGSPRGEWRLFGEVGE